MKNEWDWTFLFQVIFSLFLVSEVLLGLIVNLILYSHNIKSQKRPGFNLKEL